MGVADCIASSLCSEVPRASVWGRETNCEWEERASGNETNLSGNERESGNETNYIVGTSERLGTRLTASGNERASGDETNGEWERASVWGRDYRRVGTSERLGTRQSHSSFSVRRITTRESCRGIWLETD